MRAQSSFQQKRNKAKYLIEKGKDIVKYLIEKGVV
jgi:hypothetical protein